MRRYGVVLALALFLGAQTVEAADAGFAPPEAPAPTVAPRPGWALQITPYMWAAGLNGSMSPFRRAPTIHADKPFSDVLNDLNIGGFINVWGRYDRFVVSGDLMYVSTTESHAYGNLPPLPVALPPGTVVNAKVDTKQFMATVQGGYRILDTPAFTLDATGGVRFWHISNNVTVRALGMSASYGESFGWVDPVIGARAFLRLTDRLSLQAQADIGGFGAGARLTWSALGTVNYIFTDNISVSAGYKVLDIDYSRGGHVYKTRLHGPVAALTYRF